MASIRLHRQHGLNPTIPICFFCGEDRNEIVFLGASHKGRAPMRAFIDLEPCPGCKEKMKQGITLIERADGENPTGRWLVVKEEELDRFLSDDELISDIKKSRIAFIEPAAMNALLSLR